MSFDPDDYRLTAYALGELDPADRDAIEAILHHDPDCLAYVQGIEATARLLTEELRCETSVITGLDPSRREMIEERLAKPVLALADRPPQRAPIWLQVFALAMAASILGIAVGSLVPMFQPARKTSRSHTELAQAEIPSVSPSSRNSSWWGLPSNEPQIVSADSDSDSSTPVSAMSASRAAQATGPAKVALAPQAPATIGSAPQALGMPKATDSFGEGLAMRDAIRPAGELGLKASAATTKESEKLHGFGSNLGAVDGIQGNQRTKDSVLRRKLDNLAAGDETVKRLRSLQPQMMGNQPASPANKGMSGGMGGGMGGLAGGMGVPFNQGSSMAIAPANQPAPEILRTFERGGRVKSEGLTLPQNRGLNTAKLSELGRSQGSAETALKGDSKPGLAPAANSVAGFSQESLAKQKNPALMSGRQTSNVDPGAGLMAKKQAANNFSAMSNAIPPLPPVNLEIEPGLKNINSNAAVTGPAKPTTPGPFDAASLPMNSTLHYGYNVESNRQAGDKPMANNAVAPEAGKPSQPSDPSKKEFDAAREDRGSCADTGSSPGRTSSSAQSPGRPSAL